MRYTVEHHSIEISRFDRRFRKFDETDEMVREIIKDDTESRLWDYEAYDTLEEAKKKASDHSWRYMSGCSGRYLLIEYDLIFEDDDEKAFTDCIGVYGITT